jgi:predicted phosphate transport protein (TIGR00153 family)
VFSSLMPQRKEFYELLAAHSDRVVAGANAVLRLMNGLGEGTEDIPVLVAEVNLNEQAGDKIKYELIRLLHQSFTTPINRDQIHTLTIELDLVLNAIQDVANAVGMYNIRESTAEARELAALAADACMRLNRAVIALPDKTSRKETVDLCKEIDEIESRADRIQRKAIGSLFGGEATVWTALRMRELYALEEEVLDRCEDAAKTIEEILIENT